MRPLFDSAIELHGDRVTSDDASVQAGLVWVDAHRCAFLLTSEPVLSSAGARKSRRVMAVAESIGVPVLVGGTFPLACHRLPPDDPAAVQACSELSAAMASLGVPMVAFVEHGHDASALLAFDMVVHGPGVMCAHPTRVAYEGDRDEDKHNALIEALARVEVSPREELMEARTRRLRIGPEPV